MSPRLLCEKSVFYVRNDTSNLQLMTYASQQQKIGFLNDVKVQAGNVSKSANRLVLACYSEHLENIFMANPNQDDCLVIDEIEGESLGILIDYIYEGNITINNENVFDLISAARTLKLMDVVKFCCEFLEGVITYDSCLYILDAAKLCHNTVLQMKVIKHIEENLERVSLTRTFKNLSKTDLMCYIQLLKHDQSSEKMVYEAILRWVKHDKDQRGRDFCDLFQLIKLDQLSYEYLSDVVLQEKLVEETCFCVKLVSKALLKALKNNPENIESIIVSLGGFKTPTQMTEIFSLTDELPKQYPDLPIPFESHSSLKLNNCVYCIGGINSQSETAIYSVWRLNLKANVLKWKNIQSMTLSRHMMGVAVFCNSLVVSHGNDENEFISKTNEVYDESSNQWTLIPPLQQIRESHQLAVCDGKLFAIGGCCDAGRQVLSSVEQLTDLSTSWENVTSLLTPRKWFASVTCLDCIYVIGGRSGTKLKTILKSVERYDHVSDKWEYVSDLNSERNAHSACVLQNKIYVVGGYDSIGKILPTIECYNPYEDKWTIVGETEKDLEHHSLIVT